MERTIAKSPVIAPSLGISPVGHRMPLTVVGAECAGDGAVDQPSDRRYRCEAGSARQQNDRVTFFALLCIVTGVVVITVDAGSFEASHDAVTPAPARLKKRRRVRCGRSE